MILIVMLGWEPNSYGYHGDDGHSFCCSGTGKLYGPTFTAGDVIGCCINFINGTCFYTKNGSHLGVAFSNLKGSFFPSIGLRTPGEVVEANFGLRPFVFGIEHYVRSEKANLYVAINDTRLSDKNSLSSLSSVVLSYLIHHGYGESAKVFANAAFNSSSSSAGKGDAKPSSQTDGYFKSLLKAS
jgi:hypothetical protein